MSDGSAPGRARNFSARFLNHAPISSHNASYAPISIEGEMGVDSDNVIEAISSPIIGEQKEKLKLF
jgi:hypothetical protein